MVETQGPELQENQSVIPFLEENEPVPKSNPHRFLIIGLLILLVVYLIGGYYLGRHFLLVELGSSSAAVFWDTHAIEQWSSGFSEKKADSLGLRSDPTQVVAWRASEFVIVNYSERTAIKGSLNTDNGDIENMFIDIKGNVWVKQTGDAAPRRVTTADLLLPPTDS